MNDTPTTPPQAGTLDEVLAPPAPTLETPTTNYEPEKFIKLAKPITTHSPNGKGIEQLSEIRLRAPLAGDWLDLGGSFAKTIWTRTGMSVEEDPQKFRQWFMRLSSLDGAAFAQLSVRDLRKIQDWIADQLNDSGN